MKARIICCILLFSNCAQSQFSQEGILATHKGYQLTEEHLNVYMAMVTFGSNEKLTEETIQIHKSLLLEDFQDSPKKTLETLEEYVQLNPGTPGTENLDEKDTPQKIPHTTTSGGDNYFSEVQRRLDPKNEYPQTFNDPLALQFKVLLKGFAMYREDVFSGSSTFGGGYSYQETLYYCPDGSFIWNNISGVAQGGAMQYEKKQYHGFWTTFVQEGNLILALYSEDPEVLQMNSKGFIPLWVKSYDQNAMRIASGEKQDFLYRRIKNTLCP